MALPALAMVLVPAFLMVSTMRFRSVKAIDVGWHRSYLALFVIVYRRRAIQGALAFTDKDFWMYAVIIALAMLGFQIYLTLAEILWIKAYCIVCLGSQVTTITITALAVWRWRAAR